MTHARQCTDCGAGMNEGYVIEQGESYYCSDICLHNNYTPAEFDALYDDGEGDSYWTEWEEEEVND
jgi:hypothetical protein